MLEGLSPRNTLQRKINITKRQEEFSEEVRASKIELSSKVLDSADRLRDTLVHEMCHAAAWIIRYAFVSILKEQKYIEINID